jgi:aspartate aminotransferase-like enzyme
MDYTLLSPDIFAQLRTQRMLDLEADHFRVELRRREALDPAEVDALVAQQAEIERRYSVHQETPVANTTEAASHSTAATDHPTTEG